MVPEGNGWVRVFLSHKQRYRKCVCTSLCMCVCVCVCACMRVYMYAYIQNRYVYIHLEEGVLLCTHACALQWNMLE